MCGEEDGLLPGRGTMAIAAQRCLVHATVAWHWVPVRRWDPVLLGPAIAHLWVSVRRPSVGCPTVVRLPSGRRRTGASGRLRTAASWRLRTSTARWRRARASTAATGVTVVVRLARWLVPVAVRRLVPVAVRWLESGNAHRLEPMAVHRCREASALLWGLFPDAGADAADAVVVVVEGADHHVGTSTESVRVAGLAALGARDLRLPVRSVWTEDDVGEGISPDRCRRELRRQDSVRLLELGLLEDHEILFAGDVIDLAGRSVEGDDRVVRLRDQIASLRGHVGELCREVVDRPLSIHGDVADRDVHDLGGSVGHRG
jgi:hypothetical protein